MEKYSYFIKMTEAYPPDIRIFISNLLPVLVKSYNFPSEFHKEKELSRFDWGEMYIRDESYILGEKGLPRVELFRKVIGELQFTDEWESSSLELVDFCPPFIKDIISLKVECSESFLDTDKGSHQCLIEFNTNSLSLYDEIIEVINTKILAKFRNAKIEIISL